MKKLRLQVDDLTVESFTAGGAQGAGTVEARELTQRCGDTSICTGSSCDGTCYASCGDPNCGTYFCSGDSCGGTCDPYGCGTGGTSCDQPCVNTCDGSQTCAQAATCIPNC